jgi:hypothetical protein
MSTLSNGWLKSQCFTMLNLTPWPLIGAVRKSALTMATAIGLICVLLSSVGNSQAVPSLSSVGTGSRVPLSHLYWHFLLHQHHLDKVAAEREKQGRDGRWLRNYYQQKLGFSGADFEVIRQAAQGLQSELDDLDAEVRTVTQAERARHSRVLASPNDLPPVPPRLIELRDKREALIERHANNLKIALGARASAKLDNYLENEFAPNVRVQPVDPTRLHDPSRAPVRVFQNEVQR